MRFISGIAEQVMVGLLAAFLLAMLYLPLVTPLTPDRKEPLPPKKMPVPPPFIGGPCHWGTIVQDGRKIKIEGHEHWEAKGILRADGKLEVLWTRLADGARCPGLYTLNADGSITGQWGLGTEAQIDGEGNLVGSLNGETLRYGK